MMKMDLSGAWAFQLDEKQIGVKNEFYKKELEDCIILPTTTSEAKKGKMNIKREISHLTDEYFFEGDAWYRQEI